MQKFAGRLIVEEIKGRNGLFCVGTLKTSIGDFKVKDPALDQFKRGSYEGDFLIEKIYTKGVPWRGGFFTELIAKIAEGGFIIADETDAPPQDLPSTQAEPDPVDEKFQNTSQSAPIQEVARPVAKKRSESTENDDMELFGIELYSAFIQCAQIALDPTVDREQFRRQRDRLKEAGYRFNAQDQVWTIVQD